MNGKVRKIYPYLYSIKDLTNVFCYLIVGEKRAVLFDTGNGMVDLPAVIKKITDKPVTVILGHAHADHANGAYQFNEVFLHEKDFKLCKLHTSPPFRKGIIKSFEEENFVFPESFDADEFAKAGAGSVKALDTSQKLDLGSLTVEIIEMPAHTAGSIGVLIKEKKVLLDSDSANDHCWMFLEESLTLGEYIKMLKRTYKYDFNTFFIGHSDEAKPKTDMLKYINAAQNATMENSQVYNYVLEQLKPRIYSENGASIVFNERTLVK
ncbi:MAG: MBL fold metallo-hydrolase [Clostridiales bacterium]|nr:MBL fold metallo-hydrolase [Clostridiales bacterium]